MLFYLRGTGMRSFPKEYFEVSMLTMHDDFTGVESTCDIGTAFDVTCSWLRFKNYSDTLSAQSFSDWLKRLLT